MKKMLLICLLFLMFHCVSVEAIDCGRYEKSQGNLDGNGEYFNKEYSVLLEENTVYVTINGRKYVAFGGECPNYIYILEDGEGNLDFYKDSHSRYKILLKQVEPNNIIIDPSGRYNGITSCNTAGYHYIKECGCMPSALTDLTSRLYTLIKIAAPALLLIIGGFDLIKAMSAQDEKAINKARDKLVKKFIAAAAVFLILTIVQFLVSVISKDATNTLKCLDYLLGGYNP